MLLFSKKVLTESSGINNKLVGGANAYFQFSCGIAFSVSGILLIIRPSITLIISEAGIVSFVKTPAGVFK